MLWRLKQRDEPEVSDLVEIETEGDDTEADDVAAIEPEAGESEINDIEANDTEVDEPLSARVDTAAPPTQTTTRITVDPDVDEFQDRLFPDIDKEDLTEAMITSMLHEFDEKGFIKVVNLPDPSVVKIKMADKRYIYISGLPEHIRLSQKKKTFKNNAGQNVNVFVLMDPSKDNHYLVLAYNSSTQYVTVLHSSGLRERLAFRDYVKQGGVYALQAFLHGSLWWQNDTGEMVNEEWLLKGTTLLTPTPMGWASEITDENPYWEERVNTLFNDPTLSQNRFIKVLQESEVSPTDNLSENIIDLFRDGDEELRMSLVYGVPLKIARLTQQKQDMTKRIESLKKRAQGTPENEVLVKYRLNEALRQYQRQRSVIDSELVVWQKAAASVYFIFREYVESLPVVEEDSVSEATTVDNTNADEGEDASTLVSVVVTEDDDKPSIVSEQRMEVAAQQRTFSMAPAEHRSGRFDVTFEMEMAFYDLISSLTLPETFTLSSLNQQLKTTGNLNMNIHMLRALVDFWHEHGVFVSDNGDESQERVYRMDRILLERKGMVFRLYKSLDGWFKEKSNQQVSLNAVLAFLREKDFFNEFNEIPTIIDLVQHVLYYLEGSEKIILELTHQDGPVIHVQDYAMFTSVDEYSLRDNQTTGGIDFAQVVWDDVIGVDADSFDNISWHPIAEEWQMRLQGVSGLVPIFKSIQPVTQPIIQLWGFHIPDNMEDTPVEARLVKLDPAIKE